MKHSIGITLLLLAAASFGITSQLVVSSLACEEDRSADCCETDCGLCACCSNSLQVAASVLDGQPAGEADGDLHPESRVTPREPLPRDILHVPKAAPAA